jgi:hypothetical protein
MNEVLISLFASSVILLVCLSVAIAIRIDITAINVETKIEMIWILSDISNPLNN